MTINIIKAILSLAIIVGAILVPDYRAYLNTIIGIIVGYYFANNRIALLSKTKKVLRMKE